MNISAGRDSKPIQVIYLLTEEKHDEEITAAFQNAGYNFLHFNIID